MQEKITDTTATAPLGQPPGKKLLRVESGQYAGRLIAVIQTGPAQLSYTYADRPYTSWSSLVTIATDVADQPFDCVMDANNHLFVVYTQQSTGYLLSRRLNFSGGVWAINAAVTVYNSDSRQPSIVIDSAGDLRIAFTSVVGSIHTLRTKASTDAGATWGSGPSDSGEALTTGSSAACGKLVCAGKHLHAIYTNGGLQIGHRILPLDTGVWGSETVLGTGLALEAEFDVGVASDGRVAVVWSDCGLKYREYDGAWWGAITTLDADNGISPQLRFCVTVPVVIYLSELAAGQNRLMYTTRQTGQFSTPAVLDTRYRALDSLVLYDAASAEYADLTAAAADAATADVYHPQTSVLMQQTGDAMYVGMDHSFRFLRLLLSTSGSGGTTVFSYWDGSAWQAFVPRSGACAFDALDLGIALWEDANAIPADWQKKTINGESRFWVKVETVSAFTTAPVGSRLTAVADWRAITVRR